MASVTTSYIIPFDDNQHKAFAYLIQSPQDRQYMGTSEICVSSVTLDFKEHGAIYNGKAAFLCSEHIENYSGNATGLCKTKQTPLMKILLDSHKTAHRHVYQINNHFPVFYKVVNLDRLSFSLRDEDGEKDIENVKFSVHIHLKKLT